jgi:hypothetical protein
MQQRQLPQVAIDSWQRKLEELEWQVGAIMQEEREERALRKAEMEAQRVSCVAVLWVAQEPWWAESVGAMWPRWRVD